MSVRLSCAVFCFLLAAILLVFQYSAPLLGRAYPLTAIRPNSGLAWLVNLPPDIATAARGGAASVIEVTPEGNGPRARFCRAIGDAAAAKVQVLCHGGWRELGPAGTLPDVVRTVGGGNYVIADGWLLLSTSNGSDPRGNGLSYWLWIPRPWSARLLVLVIVGIGYLLARPGRLTVDVRLLVSSPVMAAIGIAAAVGWAGGLNGNATVKTLSIGVILLAGLYALPLSRLRSRRIAALSFVAGFVLTDLTAWSVIELLDITDDSWAAKQVKYLASVTDTRPILLLVGSSYTQYDIDEALLEDLLAAAGHPMRVLRLGTVGSPVTERLAWLTDYLSRARQTPSVALFEVSNNYDSNPLEQLEAHRYTDRLILTMDNAGAALSLEWLWHTTGPDLCEKAGLLTDVLAHWLVHAIRWPLNGASFSRIAPDPLSVLYPKTRHFTDQSMADTLELVSQIANAPADKTGEAPTAWAANMYAAEIAVLRAHGATNFGYYEPPTTWGPEVSYLRDFCAAEKVYPCIRPSEHAFLLRLAHDDDWYDQFHLHDAGRITFTLWFAAKVIAEIKLP
jgi:hypothetical protein